MSSNSNFADIQTHWAQECIRQLAQRQLVSGYPDGSFRPDAPVTRAEFAALVRKAFPKIPPVRSAITFKDVPVGHWAIQVIQAVYQAGFLSGYPDRSFKPNQPIPRVQALVALVSGLQYQANATSSELNKYFEDAAQIPAYAVNAIAAATQRYLVVNYPNVRRLTPNQNATRGEVAALICRALKLPGVPLQYVVGMDFVVIQPQFDQAGSFAEGLARVQVGNQWGYINQQGKFVMQPQFEEANPFTEGLALVRRHLG